MKWKKPKPLTEDQAAMMSMLLDTAKKQRELFKYSEDEKMSPMALLVRDDGNLEMMALLWKDHREKYQMAAMAQMKARKLNAQSLSFVTDSRWVNGDTFAEYYRLDPIVKMGSEQFQRHYHRILAAHGGEVKNLPREIWQEAIVVFTNGPNFPLTCQMAPYTEGPNDSILWIEPELPQGDEHKYTSDLLTNWWA